MYIFKKIITKRPKLWLFFLFFCLSLSTAFSQVFHGKVVDQDFNPLEKAFIRDTLSNVSVSSNSEGKFALDIADSCVIQVSYLGYKTIIRSFSTYSDSADYYFQLNPDYELLEEAVVRSDRIDKVVNKITSNVLDYVPYDDFVLVLEEYKKDRSLSIISSTEVISKFPLNDLNAHSLFEDCFGNIHILSSDSSYQIWIDGDLNFISKVPLDVFHDKIAPCVADYDEFSVFEKFTNHNKKYVLSKILKKDHKRSVLLTQWDQEGERLAREDYWKIIATYHAVMSPEGNLIRNNAWNGNLVALAFNYDLTILVGQYLKLSAQNIELSTFQRSFDLIAIDLYKDSIYNFSLTTDKPKVTGIDFRTKEIDAQIALDKKTEDFYLITNQKGIYTVRSLDPYTGKTEELLTITEHAYIDQIQVYKGWLYFTILEDNFHSLNRIRL